MSADTYWRDCINMLGASQAAGGTNETKIARVAKITGVSERVIRALFYGESVDPKYSIGKKIDDAAMKQAARFASIADSLEAKDAAFFREEVNRLRALVGRIRDPSR